MGIVWLMVLVVVVVALLGWLRPGRSADDTPSAREILDRRYAQGEISREEYLRRLEDLRR